MEFGPQKNRLAADHDPMHEAADVQDERGDHHHGEHAVERAGHLEPAEQARQTATPTARR